MNSPSLCAIGGLVEPVSSWVPERDDPSGVFVYIDLSGVDQDAKTISGAREIACSDAPSRARQLVCAGDVLVSTVRPNLNGVAFVPPELDGATASTGFCVLRPKVGQLDSRYLYHWVKSPRFVSDMVRKATGASYPAVSDRVVWESKLPRPPLSEQRRIAEILDKADALRAKRRAAIAQLDTLTQSIFIDMFGDPATNPKGWGISPVADYVESFQGGKSFEGEADEKIQTRNRVLKVSAVTSMRFIALESKPVPDTYDPPKEHFVRTGDLLFSRANTSELVGAVALVDSAPENLLLPDKLWRFVWKRHVKVEPMFVWALFQTSAVRREIEKRATGTSGSMKNISQEKLLGIRTIMPPPSRQKEFADSLMAVSRVNTHLAGSLFGLDGLFASIQHGAFTGRI